MTTSNSTNFALNAQQICEAALRLARVLGIGQTGHIVEKPNYEYMNWLQNRQHHRFNSRFSNSLYNR